MVPASLETSPPTIQAVALNAERQAILVAAYLKQIDSLLKRDGLPSVATGFPAGYLLELGAVLMLGHWDRKGLLAFLPSDLPAFADAVAELKRRAVIGNFKLLDCIASQLVRQVRQTWLERFAWEAPNLLQADVVLGDVDEDVLVEAVAQLIWVNRHNFSE